MTSPLTSESSLPDFEASRDGTTTVTLGDYDLHEVLGRGGMGTVYRALHRRLGKSVAIKVLPGERINDPSSISRFEREMQAVGKLDHPNIVQALDAREESGTHFLVMQLVRGVDVAAVVQRTGPLRVADACEIVRQAALGLQHAHEHGLVHRDIKPSNLLLSQKGVVKILDMGLALLSSETPGGELTSTGDVMGTLDYISPEQIASTHHVDIRADLYSLGCTLYKLLTGYPPFRGPEYSNPLQKMRAHEQATPPPLSTYRTDIPEEVVSIMNRLLAKNPEARFETPAQLVDSITSLCTGADLQQLIADLPPTQVNPPGSVPATRALTASHVSQTGRTETIVSKLSSAAPVEPPPASADALTFRPGTGTDIAVRAHRRKEQERRALRIGAAVGLVILGVLGWLYGAQIIRIATSKGMLVIEADEREIEVTITRGDDTAPVIVKDKQSDREYTLEMGDDYRVLVKEPATGAQFRSEQFSIVVGGQKVFDVRAVLDKHVPKPQTPTPSEQQPASPEPPQTMATRPRTIPAPPVAAPTKPSALPCKDELPPLEIEDLTREEAVTSALERGGKIGVLGPDESVWAFDRYVEDAAEIQDTEWDDLTLWMERADVENLSDGQFVSIIRALPGLRGITASNVNLTPRVLPEIVKLSRLQDVGLSGVDFRDEDLLLLHQLPRLKGVGLNSAGTITDAGLAHLMSHPNIGEFGGFLLHGQPVTDAGVIPLLEEMPLAGAVNLSRTGITDATIQAVADHPSLTTIHMNGTKVSDASIESLIAKQPRFLSLHDTMLTSAGIERLREALPECTINWEPLARLSKEEAIQKVLDWGGSFQLVDADFKAEDVADPFTIAEEDWPQLLLTLDDCRFDEQEFQAVMRALPNVGYLYVNRTNLSPLSIPTLSRMPHLVWLNANRTAIRDNDLPFLAQAAELRGVELGETKITDVGLRILMANKTLSALRLSETNVTDAGVVPLIESRDVLSVLWLNDTDITDAVLTQLTKLPRPNSVTSLRLSNTRITDAGLNHLHQLTGLKSLDITGNPISREAFESLQAVLPNCAITWDESVKRIPVGEWIDLLPLVDLEQDTVTGEWWAVDGELKSQTDKDILELPLIPYGEYELDVTLSRTSGNDAIAVNFPVGRGDTLFLLGGWGNQFGGLNMADRRLADHEENTTRRPGAIKNGQKYQFHLEVRLAGRDASVAIDIDGKRYTEFCGRQQDLQTISGFTLTNRARVGFCQNASGVTYENARLRMLTGEAHLLRTRAND